MIEYSNSRGRSKKLFMEIVRDKFGRTCGIYPIDAQWSKTIKKPNKPSVYEYLQVVDGKTIQGFYPGEILEVRAPALTEFRGCIELKKVARGSNKSV